MAKKQKTAPAPKTEGLTLDSLFDAFLKHLEDSGHTPATVHSYRMDLGVAREELGGDRLLSALTREHVARFNVSARVTFLARSGKPKSQLSIDKTRRVLRMALTWAADQGFCEPIVEPKKDALDQPFGPSEEPAPAPTPAKEKKPKAARRSRKGRVVVLEATPIAEPAAEDAAQPAPE